MTSAITLTAQGVQLPPKLFILSAMEYPVSLKQPYFQHVPLSGTRQTTPVTTVDNRGNVRSAYPVASPNIRIVEGTVSSPFVRDILDYLAWAESVEEDVWLRDDIRIAWLTVLRADEGISDPWRFAYWQLYGRVPEKIIPELVARAERHRLMGIPDYDPLVRKTPELSRKKRGIA